MFGIGSKYKAGCMLLLTSLFLALPPAGRGGGGPGGEKFVTGTFEPAACRVIEIKDGWQFRQAGTDAWHGAAVPGCVHTDLLAAGRIGDPFYGSREKDIQWIEEEDWEYRTVFTVDGELLEMECIELLFEGLDTYAGVYLNDSLLFFSDNMFCEWRRGCREALVEGENVLSVCFHSPVKEALGKSRETAYGLPGGPKVFTRKAGYHYGWDWGPRFVTSGIWRPVYIRAWSGARIENLQIVQNGVTADRAALSAVFEIESKTRRMCTVSIFLLETGELQAGIEARLYPGTNMVSLDFEIPDPGLWWTNGLGEARLYDLRGELMLDNGVVDRAEASIGIRTVEVVREAGEGGRSFYFRLNGVPVFMKGANYIPQDTFLPRVESSRYEALIRSAVEAGMNMLRVWGGGIYENDLFYDLCDRNGILVWQDFMFACAMYPGDEGFLESVRLEAVQNVKRLRNHPCIALWCGNNEIDEAWHNWGWQEQYGYSAGDSSRIWEDYKRLFHDLLPGLVKENDPGRFYWPSSPKYGRGDPRSLYEGDSHYWGVWHDGEPFEIYKHRTGRFMSEYGFQSFPALETIESFTASGDRDIESDVMLSHQKHPRGNRLIRTYMERDYNAPADFESFLYVSQVLQAEGMKIAIEAHRRAMPYCMGTLYWQLNDCWPAVSWSGIDCYGRWKALHYYVKRAYERVLVSMTENKGILSVYIVSDEPGALECGLGMKLIDFSGGMLWENEKEFFIEAGSSKSCYEIRVTDLLDGKDKDRLVLVAEVRHGDNLLSRNLHYFVPPREMTLPAPGVTGKVIEAENGYTMELTSERLAKNVFLSVDGVDGFFTDNYFDMLPGEAVKVGFEIDTRIDDIDARLRIKSLVDSYRLLD